MALRMDQLGLLEDDLRPCEVVWLGRMSVRGLERGDGEIQTGKVNRQVVYLGNLDLCFWRPPSKNISRITASSGSGKAVPRIFPGTPPQSGPCC